ncbi:MAG: hypothetical protein H6948_02310 [Zoogloeaceae bacterium]|nr:hypothetical protein [Zoogloeaceae bacterium]
MNAPPAGYQLDGTKKPGLSGVVERGLDAAKTQAATAMAQFGAASRNIPRQMGVAAGGTAREFANRDSRQEFARNMARLQNAEGWPDKAFATFDAGLSFLNALPGLMTSEESLDENQRKAVDEFGRRLAESHQTRMEPIPEGTTLPTKATEFLAKTEQGVVGSLLPAVLMRSAAPILPYVKGQEYERLKGMGYDDQTAGQLSTLAAAAEFLPESMAVDEILKPAASVLGRIGRGAVAEGAQETVTQALQDALTAGFTDPDLTVKERLMNMFEAAAMGAVGGGVVSSVAGGPVSGQNIPNEPIGGGTNDGVPEEDTPPSIDDLIGSDTAATKTLATPGESPANDLQSLASGSEIPAKQTADERIREIRDAIDSGKPVPPREQAVELTPEEVDLAPAPADTRTETQRAAEDLQAAVDAAPEPPPARNLDLEQLPVERIEAAPPPDEFTPSETPDLNIDVAEVENIEVAPKEETPALPPPAAVTGRPTLNVTPEGQAFTDAQAGETAATMAAERERAAAAEAQIAQRRLGMEGPGDGREMTAGQEQAIRERADEMGYELQDSDYTQARKAIEARLPPGYTDRRLARDFYRGWLPKLADELVEGGGIAYLTDENDKITGRTPSQNPPWAQAIIAAEKTSVAEIKKTIDAALAGEKLGAKQKRIVTHLLDEVRDRRMEEGLPFAREELAAARALRKEARTGLPDLSRYDEDADRYAGMLFDEAEYDPEWDVEARTLRELATEADAVDPEATEAILDSQRTDLEVARALWEIIGREQQQPQGTEEAEGKPGEGAPAETAGASDFQLDGYTEADLAAREKLTAERPEPPPPEDFTLTGSDAAADQAAAAGQTDLVTESRKADPREAVPDSAFNGDLEESLNGTFMSDSFKGDDVGLASKGFTSDEIAALEAAGMATDGRMSREQYARWMDERSYRLTPKSKRGSRKPEKPNPKAPKEPLDSQRTDLEARDQQKREAEQARQSADRKAEADAQRDDYRLTGSDREADEAAARGQDTLFARRSRRYPLAPRGEWYGDANYEQTGGRMVEMAPDEYLAAARPIDPTDELTAENVDDLVEHIRNGGVLDPLALYPDGREDGRHRALAAKRLGIKTVPVLDFRDAGKKYARRQSSADERNLIITHNLTAGNVLHAAKMGGIPVPSLAITKVDAPLEAFGEITLIGSPAMADPRGYARPKVFGSDAYSPRYPRFEYKIDSRVEKALKAKFGDAGEAVGARGTGFEDIESRGPDDIANSASGMYQFLTERGEQPEVVTRSRLQPSDIAFIEGPLAQWVGTRDYQTLGRNPDFQTAVIDAINQQMIEAQLPEVTPADWLFDVNDLDTRHNLGMKYAKLVEIHAEEGTQPRPDEYATRNALRKQIDARGLTKEFDQWVESVWRGLDVQERIFNGYTYAGSRRYKAHTLDNVVAMMKKDLRGGESFNYGAGSVRAKITPQFKSITAIRKAKGQLVTKAQMDAVKEESNEELAGLGSRVGRALRLDSSNEFIATDRGIEFIGDVGSMGWSRALREWGAEGDAIGENLRADIAEFLTKLRNAPTEYFEAIIPREVDFSEFKAAVAPKDTDPRAVKALVDRGVKVTYYDRGAEGDRARAIREASRDVLFARRERGWSDVIRTEVGPWFVGRDVSLVPAGVENAGQWGEDAILLATDTRTGDRLAKVMVGLDGDRIHTIYGLYSETPRSGAGRRVVEAIVAAANAPVTVDSIVQDARGFWDKVGAHDYVQGQDGNWNATITGESLARAAPGAGRQGAAGRAPDPGRGPGGDGAGQPETVTAPGKGLSVPALRESLASKIGRGTLKRLEDDGTLVITTSTDAKLPEDAKQAVNAGDEVYGFTSGGRVYLIADNLTDGGPATVDGQLLEDGYAILMHELGVHFGMPRMTGDKRFREIVATVRAARKGDGNGRLAQAARRAYLQVPEDTNPEHVDEEVVAWLVTDRANHDLPLVKRLLAAIRSFLVRHGFVKALDPDTLVYLARGAAMRASGQTTLKTMYAKSESFASSVSRIIRGEINLGYRVDIGETPDVLRAIGMPDLRLAVVASTVDKIHFDHGLTEAEITEIPQRIADPVMVFESETQPGSFVVVTDLVKNGSPVIAAIHPGKEVAGVEVNLLASAYPKGKMPIARWFDDGLLRYAHTQKGPDLADAVRLQLPWAQRGQGLPKNVVTQRSVVKKIDGDRKFARRQNVTDTEAFRRWFGDSKVVDENGEPLVVYHASGVDFDAFDTEKGAHFGSAPQANMRGVSGKKRLIPAYLAIKNPRRVTDRTGWSQAIKTAKSREHDGIVYLNRVEGISLDEFESARAKLRGGETLDNIPDTKFRRLIPSAQDSYIAFRPEQIKSATGNSGAFDAGNPDIRFARRVQETRREVEDAIEEPATTLAENYKNRANAVIDWLDRKTNPIAGLADIDTYLKDRYLTLGRIAKSQSVAKGVYDVFRKADKAEGARIYAYLTDTEASPNTIQDPALREKAIEVKGLIEQTGRALVDAGVIPQESFDNYQGRYLPRIYLAYLLGDKAVAAVGAGKSLSSQDYAKHRNEGLTQEYRDVILGEIKDPAFLASKALGVPLRDLAVLQWLSRIAENPQWVLPGQTVEWTMPGMEKARKVTPYWLKSEASKLRQRAAHYADAAHRDEALSVAAEMDRVADQALSDANIAVDEVPDGYKQVPNSARYGAIRGLVVRKEVYDDIIGIGHVVNKDSSWPEKILGYGGVGTKVQQVFKWAKVAANPPAQVRNLVSNWILLDLSGVPLRRIPGLLARAANQLRTKGKYFQISQKYGVTESTFAAQELMRIERETVDLMRRQKEGYSVYTLLELARKVMDATGDVYQGAETLGKIMKIMHAMEHEGLTEGEAAIEAQRWLFDYSLVGRGTRFLRNAPIGMPFLTFTLKVLPRLAEAALKRPLVYAKYAALGWVLKEAALAMLDLDDGDDEKLAKALPEWLRERGGGVLMPAKDENNRFQFVDIGYFLPWSYWTELGRKLVNLPKDFSNDKVSTVGDLVTFNGLFGGPMTSTIAALTTGVDPFTKREIVPEQATLAEKFGAAFTYTYNMMMPSWLVGFPMLGADMLHDQSTYRGALGHLYEALTGTTDRRGEPRSTTWQAIARFGGVNIYGVEPQKSRSMNIRHMRYEIQQTKAMRTHIKKDRSIAFERRKKLERDYTAKIRRMTERLNSYIEESMLTEKLR